LGSLALKRFLSLSPITTSLTSGMPRRDTCTSSPLAALAPVRPAAGEAITLRFIGTLAVVHAPMMSPLPSVRHAIGISRTIAVTFLSPSESTDANSASGLSSTAGYLMLTRSNVSPRLTTNGSLRWPTNTRPFCAQPGTAIGQMWPFA
jgi:hypothetical protein